VNTKRRPTKYTASMRIAANSLSMLADELRAILLRPFEPVDRATFVMMLLSPGEDQFGDPTSPLIDDATAEHLMAMR
jgi:hypothetical protein